MKEGGGGSGEGGGHNDRHHLHTPIPRDNCVIGRQLCLTPCQITRRSLILSPCQITRPSLPLILSPGSPSAQEHQADTSPQRRHNHPTTSVQPGLASPEGRPFSRMLNNTNGKIIRSLSWKITAQYASFLLHSSLLRCLNLWHRNVVCTVWMLEPCNPQSGLHLSLLITVMLTQRSNLQ